MRNGWKRAITLVAAIAGSTAGAAHAQQANNGPLSALIQAICIPWTQGMKPQAMADALSAHGIQPNWVGDRLAGFELPPREGFEFAGVTLAPGHDWCEVKFLFKQSRVAALDADIAAFATRTTPAYHFVKVKPRAVDGGSTVPDYTWSAPAALLSIDERGQNMPFPGTEEYKEVLVHFQKLGG